MREDYRTTFKKYLQCIFSNKHLGSLVHLWLCIVYFECLGWPCQTPVLYPFDWRPTRPSIFFNTFLLLFLSLSLSLSLSGLASFDWGIWQECTRGIFSPLCSKLSDIWSDYIGTRPYRFVHSANNRKSIFTESKHQPKLFVLDSIIKSFGNIIILFFFYFKTLPKYLRIIILQYNNNHWFYWKQTPTKTYCLWYMSQESPLLWILSPYSSGKYWVSSVN